jgi:hypothetical protein
LGLSGLYWYNALLGEVNALCMFLQLASATLFLRRRAIGAGALYGLALLVSQLAVPWAVVFLFFALWRGQWRDLALATLAGTVTVALGIAPVFDAYLYGPRGVITVAEHSQSVSVPKLIFYFCYRVLTSFTIAVLPLLVGMVSAARRHKPALALAIILTVTTSALSIRSPHVEYGVTWMAALFGFAALAGIGLQTITARFARTKDHFLPQAAFLLVLGLLTWRFYVEPKRSDAERFASSMRTLASIVRGATVVAAPEEGMAFVYLTQPDARNLWGANWRLTPRNRAGWDLLLASPPVYGFTTHPESHVFRRFLFNNPLAVRALDPSQRAHLTAEQTDELSDQLAVTAGYIRSELILDTGYLRVWRLWRVRTTAEASVAPTAGTKGG